MATTSPKLEARSDMAASPQAKRAKTLPSILSVGPWATKEPARSPSAESLDVTSPASGEKIAEVKMGSAADVDAAVDAATKAFPAWSGLTQKRRAMIMMKFHSLCTSHEEELIELIMLENGKNRTEAAGDLAKGLETVEWACSIPQHAGCGKVLAVSSGVTCEEMRDPVGVVACIVVTFSLPTTPTSYRLRLLAT